VSADARAGIPGSDVSTAKELPLKPAHGDPAVLFDVDGTLVDSN